MAATSIPAVFTAQTGHPITRAATLPTASPNTALLICAGGASVSVQAVPRWWVSAASGNGSGGVVSGVVGSAAAFHQPRHSVEAPTVSGAEVGKGADALLSLVQQFSAQQGRRDNNSSNSTSGDGGGVGAGAALPAEQRATLNAGEVTSLCVASLPGTVNEAAVAVVGTTVGTVALFLLEGSRSLYKVAERSLVGWSRGALTSQDAVVDVAFSMDPAGRPEFVSAASAGSVVVVDVQLLYRDREVDEAENEEGNEDRSTQQSGETLSRPSRQRTAQQPSSANTTSDVWSSSVLRAKAVEALECRNGELLRRSRSDVFTCAFVDQSVVRVLAPQRLHAAVALDVALVIVLSDGTLHYVERVVEGGSVRLLAEHHRLRFAKGARFIAYAHDAMVDVPASATASTHGDGGGASQGAALSDGRVVPHVVYRYRLAPHCLNVCQAGASTVNHSHAVNGGFGSSGVLGSAAPAASSLSSAGEVVTTINDAALYFSEKDAVCHVVVAGTQLVPTHHKTHARPASPVGGEGGSTAGWTLGRLQQTKAAPQTVSGYRAVGWWAVVHNAVLPRCTFDRVSLERQAFERASRNRNTTQAAASASYAASFASAYCTDSGSPFMVHVQSSVMALPAAPHNAAAALAMNAGRQVATTAAAAAAAANGRDGLEGSSSHEALSPSSPVLASPTGTGAHVAASNTTAGVGNGFATASMMAGVLVLSSGTDVYVGDLSEVPASAKALPVLRPVRSFGAVVESVTFGPSQDARSVLVASGSRVVPVAL